MIIGLSRLLSDRGESSCFSCKWGACYCSVTIGHCVLKVKRSWRLDFLIVLQNISHLFLYYAVIFNKSTSWLFPLEMLWFEQMDILHNSLKERRKQISECTIDKQDIWTLWSKMEKTQWALGFRCSIPYAKESLGCRCWQDAHFLWTTQNCGRVGPKPTRITSPSCSSSLPRIVRKQRQEGTFSSVTLRAAPWGQGHVLFCLLA